MHAVGDKVRYHPVIGGAHDGRVYTISFGPADHYGIAVYWLAEKAGCVAAAALSRLEVSR